MKRYACVRTDNLFGTVHGGGLVSLKYDGEIENGSILKVGNYLDGEREIRKGTIPAIDTKLSDLALVSTPEVIKEKTYYSIADFVNKDGDAVRGYKLISKDIYSVTKEGFAEGSKLSVGAIVELSGSEKLKAVETATEGSTTVGKIVSVEDEWYVIEIA